MKRVLFVEDHKEMRNLYEALFRDETDIVTSGVESAEAALSYIGRLPPHLAVIDISLPGINGLELAAILAKSHPAIRLLVVTGHPSKAYYEDAIKAGADDLVSKASPNEIISAVKRLVCE